VVVIYSENAHGIREVAFIYHTLSV
jgi:hypothetical protein